MTEQLRVEAAPRSRWQAGRYTFGRRERGKWSVSDGCLGVDNYRTPVGAFLALLRWRRENARMTPAQRITEG